MNNESVIIIGGDKRQEYIYSVLSEDGYDCEIINKSTDNIEDCLAKKRYVILPVPASKDGKNIYCSNKDFIIEYSELGKILTDKHIVFGVGLPKELIYQMNRNNTVYYDLNNNEDLLVYNAFLTAQGALKLLLDNTEKDINSRKVIVTGFGRIGKALAILLKGLNMKITVCVRKDSQQNLAGYLGLRGIKYDTLKDEISDADFIFNTVPEQVFNTECISRIKKNAVYFELASAPFGADKSQLTAYKVKRVDAGSLPGRYTPYSAGEKIARILENLIQRRYAYEKT